MLKKNENIVARQIHGAFFLIDLADHYLDDKCVLYEINETGWFVWNTINGSFTIDEIVSRLKDSVEDDIDYQQIHDDVTDFIRALKSKRFIEA